MSKNPDMFTRQTSKKVLVVCGVCVVCVWGGGSSPLNKRSNRKQPCMYNTKHFATRTLPPWGDNNCGCQFKFDEASKRVITTAKSCTTYIPKMSGTSSEQCSSIVTIPTVSAPTGPFHHRWEQDDHKLGWSTETIRHDRLEIQRWTFRSSPTSSSKKRVRDEDTSKEIPMVGRYERFRVRSSVKGYSISTTPYMDILTRIVNHRPTWTDLTVPKISVLKSFVRNMMTKDLHGDDVDDVDDHQRRQTRTEWEKELFTGVKVTQYEWLVKECVFQNIPISSCYTICKCIHNHHNAL